MYIDALDAYFKADDNKKKERNEAYAKALERILYKYPDDIEARALLGLAALEEPRRRHADQQLPGDRRPARSGLQGRPDAPGASLPHSPVGPASGPRTPSAPRPSAGRRRPGIAHMWHMPGHIYSKTQALRRRLLAAGGLGPRRSRPHDARPRAARSDSQLRPQQRVADSRHDLRRPDAGRDRPGQEHVRAAAASEIQHADQGQRELRPHAAVRGR